MAAKVHPADPPIDAVERHAVGRTGEHLCCHIGQAQAGFAADQTVRRLGVKQRDRSVCHPAHHSNDQMSPRYGRVSRGRVRRPCLPPLRCRRLIFSLALITFSRWRFRCGQRRDHAGWRRP